MLLLVPLVAFVVPALCNAPALSGDNLIQNFPLRAFSGELVRQGHLPLWNPFIWSGSPLLGGMNAGSFFPLTFLFVMLPPIGAWVLNMTAVYWVAGLGTYWLLHEYGIRPLAGFLGAAVYAYSGVMIGQMVHLGIIQGMALMPVIVLAILKISWAVFGVGPATRSESTMGGLDTANACPVGSGVPASSWPWVVGLAVLVGLVMLTGEPRSIAETEIVGAVLALWLTLRGYGEAAVGWRRRVRFLGATVLAGAWGVAIGAAQLLPGYDFINLSQRANEPYSFFASGSLHTQWTVLLLVPDLFGGSGTLHQPVYFNGYNLPEVTGYVGLLPLVAGAALLTRTFGRSRDRAAADWAPWLVFALLGLLLAWGQFTPLGGLFGHIPIFGRTRLQSRSLGIVDLALAVLFAFSGRPRPGVPARVARNRRLAALGLDRPADRRRGCVRRGHRLPAPARVRLRRPRLGGRHDTVVRRTAGGGGGRRRSGARLAPPRRGPGPVGAERRGRGGPGAVRALIRHRLRLRHTRGGRAQQGGSRERARDRGSLRDLLPGIELRRARGDRPARPERVHHAPERPGLRLHSGQHLWPGHRLALHRLPRPVCARPWGLRAAPPAHPAHRSQPAGSRDPKLGGGAERARPLSRRPPARHGHRAHVVLRPSTHADRGHAGCPGAQRLDGARRLDGGRAQSGRRRRLPRPDDPDRRRPRHRGLPLSAARRGPGRAGRPEGGVGHLRGHYRGRSPLCPRRQCPGRARPARMGLHRHVGRERPLRAGVGPPTGVAEGRAGRPRPLPGSGSPTTARRWTRW